MLDISRETTADGAGVAASPAAPPHAETTRQSLPWPQALQPVLSLAVNVLSWAVPLLSLAWAVRLVLVEGYLYEIPGNFAGDFTRTAMLDATTYWSGQGLFYGPLFVLESRFLVKPGLVPPIDFARLDFVLFGLAFACVWLALFGAHRPRLAIFVLAAWLGNHMTVELFSNTAHLEVLELTCIAVALLLAVRGQPTGAGLGLGLAIATKTLPAVFLPYLALTRRWRMLIAALACAGVFFLGVCWLQGVSPVEGATQLIVQGGNLTKPDYSEYEYGLRAEFERMLVGDGGSLSTAQAVIAGLAALGLALAGLAWTAWVLRTATLDRSTDGLMFGLLAALLLIVSPSVHTAYYVFLLPGWTAILAALVQRPPTKWTIAGCLALAAAYTMVGFDQPFFLMQRVFGVGLVVPQHWLAWHFPLLGLLLSLGLLSVLLLRVRPAVSLPAESRR